MCFILFCCISFLVAHLFSLFFCLFFCVLFLLAKARNATLLWASAFPSGKFLRTLRATVRINHLPRSTELSHKQRLYASRVVEHDFFSPSFVLPAQSAALRRALDGAELGALWIAKPGRSGSGKNVRVLSCEGVRALLAPMEAAGGEESVSLFILLPVLFHRESCLQFDSLVADNDVDDDRGRRGAGEGEGEVTLQGAAHEVVGCEKRFYQHERAASEEEADKGRLWLSRLPLH